MVNVPKLRFPEFSGEWEEHELGKYLIEFDNKVRRKDDHPILTSSREGLFLQNKYFKQEVISKSSALYRVLPKGYFTYRYMSDDSFFRININELGFDGLVSQEYPVFTTNEGLNKEFLKQHFYGSKAFIVFCTIQKRGGTRTRLYFDTLKKYKIIMPTFPEQTKIANFLTLFDNKIEKQSEKVAALEEYKKGLMKIIFSQEIRFKDDEGKDYPEWEMNKLINLLKVRDERQVPNREAPLMAFTSTGGVEEKGDRYNRDFLVKDKNKKYKRTEFNDLIYSSNNLDVGAIGRNKYGTAVISDVYEIFIAKENVTPNFLEVIIKQKNFLNKVLKYRQGALYGQYRIHADDFLSIEITLPALPEQTKIANFLSLFDRKIEKEKAKLEALREQKKGLLQQMFV